MYPPPQLSEAAFLETLTAARSGDKVATQELFQLFYPRVQRMVHARLARDLRSTRPWLAARFSTGDVVQEVFRSVLGDLDAFAGRNEGAFAGYLAMVVRNRIIDAVRFHEAATRDGRRSRDVQEDTDGPVLEDDPVDELVNREELGRFQLALETFTPREQLLIRARLEGTASFRDLADQLGFGSASAARRAFHGAQARLAFMLKEGSDAASG